MADISVQQKQGGGLTWLWALLAVAAVIGLMLWLGAESADIDEQAALAADSAAVAEREPAAAGGEAAELAAIASDPAGFTGRPLAVSGVPVAATLGPRAFWAEVPGANPFLVVLAPEVANPEAAAIGQRVDLGGSVADVTPEVVTEWVQQGVLNEGARAEAEFATHYLLASQMTPAAAAPAAAPAQQ